MTIEQRAAPRFPTELEADCRSCNRSWTARLWNISATGCMIACPGSELPDGALLRLRLKGLTAIDGKIVWQHRAHAGIRFVNPLHHALMEHLGFGDAVRPIPATPLRPELVRRGWQDEPSAKVASYR